MSCKIPRLLLIVTLMMGALSFVAAPAASAQVTTAQISGLVKDSQGAVVPGATITAVHEPSGTTYSGVTQGDGQFDIRGMRVGGPYRVTAELSGFRTETQSNINLSLGVAQNLSFTLALATVSETVEVVGTADAVFSSSRTGAATSVTRDDMAELPTISGRISDLTRLTPQASGTSFAGQDNRENNMTVDGSSFNNSFGLGDGQPGGRTNVAPISLESIEQVQVNVAPFDVRQGNFVGAAVNTVTRSGTNQLTASVYTRMRNQDWVGTEADGLPVNPGTFDFRNTGVWAGGPIVKNRLFAFGNFEDEKNTAPLHTFRANQGGEPVGGSVTRVASSDLDTLSSFLSKSFGYETGGYNDLSAETPAKRYLIRSDYNLNNRNKINFRYSQLDSSQYKLLSGSTSAGLGRTVGVNGFIPYANSNYNQLEDIKSAVGELNTILGSTLSNNLIVGYTTNNENRLDPGKLFPVVDILGPDGTTYINFGTESFTPNNELLYHTYQLQDSVTKFANKHSLTFGGSAQKYQSDNSFFNCCKQSLWVYNSLSDFYADANGFLANPNRTTSPVTARRFQVRYMNIPGLEKPMQILKVTSFGGWAQDEWRARKNLTITGGVRADISSFGDTAYSNPNADALTFRDENGAPVKYVSGHLPDAKLLWSPRVGFNWDVASDQNTQIRGGTGIFSGTPLFVWLSNQLGNTGVLQGSILEDNTTARPFTTNIDQYKPTNVTGAGAASYELDVTDNAFKFPQVWRSDVAVDRRLPGGFIFTEEFLYNKDVNGIYYIQANLPAAQSAFAGVDNRPRWTGASCSTPTAGPCITRLNNAAGNQVTGAFVVKNQSVGHSWNLSSSLSKSLSNGLSGKFGYSYGDAQNTIDPGSTASSSWNINEHSGDPNNPGVSRSQSAQGNRVFAQVSYSRSYFSWGTTTISGFMDMKPALIGAGGGLSTNASYVFSGDMNGDGGAGNDLIYIPRNTSEMNFVAIPATATTRAFSVDEQVAAFEAYINQDPYLSKHRGQYAERGGLWMPLVNRIDLNVTQDIFRKISGKRHAGQIRLDIVNFGNMLNHNWGVSSRLVAPITQAYGAQILTNPGVDSQGRATYRMAVASGALVTNTFQPNNSVSTFGAGSDVYQFMLSFRYSFN